MVIGLEKQLPRSMELLVVSTRDDLSLVTTFAEGTEQLTLELPHGFYELTLDGRYTGISISIPQQTQTVLLVPPPRGD